MATREEIDEVRNRADIIEVVSRYVKVRQNGTSATALCPFHDDKSPSMTVSSEKGFFHCFACKAGGDVFKFIMQIEKVDFPEALRRLADQVGVTLSRDGQRTESQDKVRSLGKRVVAYYQNCLNEAGGKRAHDYLINRGLSSEVIEQFQLGYAPNTGEHLLKQFGSEQADLTNLGLLLQNDRGPWSFFRGRVIFPLCSIHGDVLGFAGRVLDKGEPKYLNTRASKLFDKSRLLYGMHLARETMTERGYALLVEGYTDVIMAHQHGFKNAIASMGTAFTSEQARLLKRFVPKVLIAYDRDSSGQAATVRGISQLLTAGLEVQIVELPQGEDPDGLLRKEGAGAFESYLANTRPFTKYYVSRLVENKDTSNWAIQDKIITEAMEFVEDITSFALRSDILKELSGILKIPVEDLELKMKSDKRPAIIEPIDSEKLSWEVEEHLMALLLQGHIGIDQLRQNLNSSDFQRYSDATDVLYTLSTEEQVNFFHDETGKRLLGKWMERLGEDDQSDLRRLALSEVRDKDCERAARQLVGRLKLTSLAKRLRQLQREIREEEENHNDETVLNLQKQFIECQMERKRLLQELGWGTIIVKGGGRD